jgi:Fe2+ or Zn2+ uptake regulation protein
MGRERGKKAKAPELRLRARLETQGAHLTRQRAAVYEYLRTVDHHPTAHEVYFAVRRRMPKIGLATVYKNLEALVSCGAVSRLDYGDGAARYDIRTDRHYHSRCLRCGAIRDIEPGAGTIALRRLRLPAGFEVTDCRLEVLGCCRACRS